MLGGSASSSRSRLGFTRGGGASAGDRAKLGFSRGASRDAMGVVRSQYANAANPTLKGAGATSQPSGGSDAKRQMEEYRSSKAPFSGGGGGSGSSCRGGSCSVPIRDRAQRRNLIEEHNRIQETLMEPLPGSGKRPNRRAGSGGGLGSSKSSRRPIPDFMKRDFSKYEQAEPEGGFAPPEDEGYGRQDEGYGRQDEGYAPSKIKSLYPSESNGGSSQETWRPEPEPEEYSFGPPSTSTSRFSKDRSRNEEPKDRSHTEDLSTYEEPRVELSYQAQPLPSGYEPMAPVDPVTPVSDHPDQVPSTHHEVQASFPTEKLEAFFSLVDERFEEMEQRVATLHRLIEANGSVESSEAPQVYGKVGVPSLFFFADIPDDTVPEADYEGLSIGVANEGDWVTLGNPVEGPTPGSSWYPVTHVDPETGMTSRFFTPSSMGGTPVFSLFSSYPV